MQACVCWVWVALWRCTQQVVSWLAGDRSADSCRQLWAGIPEAYRAANTCSDFWPAYEGVVVVVITNRSVRNRTNSPYRTLE
ncbi:MAG: hypothetical protein ACXWFX_15120 [Methylobacter sp.]